MASLPFPLERLVSRDSAPTADATLPDDSRAPRTLAVVGSLTGFAGLVVILRVYARGRILKRCGMDDYITSFALACAFGVFGCFIGESQHGLGRYTKYISHDDQEILRKYTFYHSIIVMIGISAVKISLGFFLLRVAAQSTFRRFIIGAIVFLVAFTIACAGTLIFQCVPVAGAWDMEVRKTAKCFSLPTFTAIGIFNSSINIVTDVIFATLPIPMFYTIQVNKRTKASLMAILSLGYFACAAAIVKLVAQMNVMKITDQYRDSTFTTWNAVELNVGILAASLPTIRPLVKSLLGATRSLTSGTRSRKRTRTGYYSHHGSIFAMRSLHDNQDSRNYIQTSAIRASSDGGEDFAERKSGDVIMRKTEVVIHRDSPRLGPRRDADTIL
ncbi:hypothetical protein MW887_011626 [Aspergillus wentii]|nr:hypothetical protein MW887_011626 [Aspergillus wentii]